MCSLHAKVDEAHARFSSARADLVWAVADLAASDEWKRDGALDLASWLCARCQISLRSAREIVRDVEALGERPVLVAALAAGSASADQCRALAILGDADSDVRALENLPFWSYSELEREARKETARTLEFKDGGTFLRMRATRDERFLRGEFQIEAGDGAVLIGAVDARIPANTLPRDLDQASAVALVEFAAGSAPLAQQRAIVLLADDIAELSTGGVVGAETGRRLACDATVNGMPIPTTTRRKVEARDGYRCTFPGCERDRFLQCHHIVHRVDGGSNDVANLQLVCSSHHKLIHEGGWSLRGAAPNAVWTCPDGMSFDPRPP